MKPEANNNNVVALLHGAKKGGRVTVPIQFFGSFEEMMEAEKKSREIADRNVKPWQALIKKGDCFRQWTPYGFEIFSEVLEGYQEEHLKNYRLCHCYSLACPEGERGDIHVSVVESLIDRDTFEQIKKRLRQGSLQ